MELTIFGATGATGTLLTGQALAAGHQVTAVVRDPARLSVPDSPRLRVMTADLMDPVAISPAVAGADAVLAAFGPRGTGPTTVLREGTRSVIEAMGKEGTRRLITVSGSIVTDEGEGPVMRYLVKPLARRTALRHVAADMRGAEEETREQRAGLDDHPAAPAHRPTCFRHLPDRDRPQPAPRCHRAPCGPRRVHARDHRGAGHDPPSHRHRPLTWPSGSAGEGQPWRPARRAAGAAEDARSGRRQQATPAPGRNDSRPARPVRQT